MSIKTSNPKPVGRPKLNREFRRAERIQATFTKPEIVKIKKKAIKTKLPQWLRDTALSAL